MATKTAKQAFQRLCRTALLFTPDQVEPHVRAMHTSLVREVADGNEDALDWCEVLEGEIARYERATAERRQDPNGPTLQTARNLQQDPVLVMLQRGAIDKGDEITIEELRGLRFKLSQGLVPGGGGTGERVDTSTKGYEHPIEKLSVRQDMIHRHVYQPWVRSYSKNIKVGKRARVITLTPFKLVTMVIEGDTTLRQLEKQFRMNQSNGELGHEFRKSLRDFASRLGKAESEGTVPRRKS